MTEGVPWFAGLQRHGPAGPAAFIPNRGWTPKCLCGAEFTSWSWDHVPALYDHLATRSRAAVSHE